MVTPPTNVGLTLSSVSRTWLTVFTGTLLHMIGKCPILLHLLHRVSAAGQFLLPGGVGQAVAITTVPAARLERPPLRVSPVTLLYILAVLGSGLFSRGVTLSISAVLILVTHVLLLPSRTGFSLPFRVKGLLLRHGVSACNCLPFRKR